LCSRSQDLVLLIPLIKDVNPDLPSYTSQVSQLDAAISAYGTSRILGVTVGNEYILNAPSRGDTITNATTWLISRITDYKTHLQNKTLSLPVGTSDAAGTYLGSVAPSTDYLFVNIHPWFSDNTYEQAAWFSSTYMENIIEPMVNTTWPSHINGTTPHQLFQGEFGWPSASDSAALGVNAAGSPAGIPQMQRVLE
jgi:exo-beta-1,3-glucanase (GH17 family)